jgi:hypothetical protein
MPRSRAPGTQRRSGCYAYRFRLTNDLSLTQRIKCDEVHRLISKRTAMVLLNLGMLMSLWASGEVKADPGSIAAAALAVIIMNCVAWRSGKDFPGWK